MEKYALNDVAYNFKPFEIFSSDSGYKVDEEDLKKGIQKSKEIIARARKSRVKELDNI